MVRVTIIAVGKLKERYLVDGMAEYAKRLRSYCQLSIVEVKDEPFRDGYSQAQQDMVKAKEAERILRAIPERSYVIALDIQGQMESSEAMAAVIDRLGVEGWNHIVFIIGGALGLHASVIDGALLRLSFSPLTFPHQLMRLVLLEQLYRWFTIIRGESYHH